MQTFAFPAAATSRFWRLYITSTASGWQPYIRDVRFIHSLSRTLDASDIVLGVPNAASTQMRAHTRSCTSLAAALPSLGLDGALAAVRRVRRVVADDLGVTVAPPLDDGGANVTFYHILNSSSVGSSDLDLKSFATVTRVTETLTPPTIYQFLTCH